MKSDSRQLRDLSGIGKAMLRDFDLLNIKTVPQLAEANPQELFDRLCQVTKSRQDPCVLDTFECAVEQARNPGLPAEQRNWWFYSARRKAKAAK